MTLRTASDNFELFARDWLVKIGRSLRHTDANMDIASAHSGYVASFTKIATDSMQLKVKPSSSPSCSYIGVLKYEEHHFEGHGETHDKAQQGPFSRVGRLKVTEIFRFVAGRWVN
ncbi:hypothetical protein [Desulfovibrio ferrophilus]|uniref:hypothetical protein n=1 Tax=Desulfovibrio ferrophilus TaxID=241368 RepID=UPI000F84A89D|nr:hypothetical protein [Desulfovibrio ferrophilus]